jgi:hypothetical protein
MLNFLSHQRFPALLGLSARAAHAPAQLVAACLPDFDLSDLDEPPPTVPGGYWHQTDKEHDDASKLSRE